MVVFLRYRLLALLLIYIFIEFSQLSAQNDSSAKNRSDSVGITSDSIINKRSHYKPGFIANLPKTVQETSGLIFFDKQLWTINDSGNKLEIYQLDTSNGSVVRKVEILNSANTDWESITQDEASVYVGDFGNNSGNRKDLCILKISKSDFQGQTTLEVKAEHIYFSYPDQTQFATTVNNHNFDCEAFLFYNDSLHLFSKNWADLKTKHYVLPVAPGNYIARLAESYNVDGLITDASINNQGNIVLLGYKNTRGQSYSCFAWLLSDYEGQLFFSGNKRRVELGSALHLGQTEGIVLKVDNTGWISSESIHFGKMRRPAKLFSFNFAGYFGEFSNENK